ncbi:MAG: hypothetical protein R6X08_04300, partial [Desulfosalsimonadaceae bacterium]
MPETAGFAAPAFHEKADTQDFRELLFREFDLSKVTPKPPEDKKTAEPETAKPDTAKLQPPPSAAELLAKKFRQWSPEKLFVPAVAAGDNFAAPAFHEKADTQDFRELLFREFDLSKVTPKPPEDKKTAEPETAKPDTA